MHFQQILFSVFYGAFNSDFIKIIGERRTTPKRLKKESKKD